jgi:hypothetical protein
VPHSSEIAARNALGTGPLFFDDFMMLPVDDKD